jgi:hypothetical protein
MLEKETQSLLEVATPALVQSQDLFGVQKTELGHVADEFEVAGSQFKGVGCLAPYKLFAVRLRHEFHLKLYAKATPEPRPPFVLSRYLFPRTPHDKQKETTGQTKGGRGTGAAPATAERSGGQQAERSEVGLLFCEEEG